MEQLLIVEDDIGLNQGLCKALKADDRQIISCHDLKAAREQLLCGSVSLVLLGLIAGGFCLLGHFIGSGMMMKNGSKIVRPVIIVVLVLLFIKVISDMAG